MDFTNFFNSVIDSIKAHSHVLFTGSLGATFGFLLSKEPLRDRIVGFLCGFILCMVFSEPASHFLANDAYPELFGFVIGAIGRNSAEAVLNLVRIKVLNTVSEKTNTSIDNTQNDQVSNKEN